MGEESFVRVDHPLEVAALLEGFAEAGGATLELEEGGDRPLPVVVALQAPGEPLLLDISAVREVAATLGRGAVFRLGCERQGKRVRTLPLAVEACEEVLGRMICRCPYPVTLELLQRRNAYRARLRLGMEVGAIVRGGEEEASIQGDLKDISLQGCQIELPLTGTRLLAPPALLEVELCFPNGTRFLARAASRHQVVDTERQCVRVGFQFLALSGEQERRLWFLVSEVEREAARQATVEETALQPSPLFQAKVVEAPAPGRRNLQRYATPMARRLARVAGYLDAQLLELQQGGRIDSAQLSRHADRLLALHEEDREALLFATRCLYQEPVPVRHGVGVAVQLLDLASTGPLPREIRKALAACAMVHDLGKPQPPDELAVASRLSAEQRTALQRHVSWLLERLSHCQWLAGSVVTAVVERINERLDGSGYPAGLEGDRLHELTRLASVVDALEAMRRDRPDRPAWTVAAAYRHLLTQPERFDPRWVKRYIRHFGVLPIGTLVRFAGGELGWVQRLDRHGRLAQVQLSEAVAPPGEALGEVLRDARLEALGAPVEEVVVST